MTRNLKNNPSKKKSSVLGRGLGNLLSVDEQTKLEKEKQGILDINIDLIRTDQLNPRKRFDEKAIEELAKTVKQHGLLQPILVVKDQGFYKVVSGERRLRASRLLGLESVPCIVKEYSGRDKLEISLIENIQREQLDPIEEASVYKNLIDKYDLTQEEISERVGKNRTTITNRIRLLKLPMNVQTALADGKLTEGQARPLLSFKDQVNIEELVDRIIKKNLSARQVEEMAKAREKKAASNTANKKDPNITSLENELESILDTRIRIDHNGKKKRGRIIIEYFSLDDFDRILNLLKKQF